MLVGLEWEWVASLWQAEVLAAAAAVVVVGEVGLFAWLSTPESLFHLLRKSSAGACAAQPSFLARARPYLLVEAFAGRNQVFAPRRAQTGIVTGRRNHYRLQMQRKQRSIALVSPVSLHELDAHEFRQASAVVTGMRGVPPSSTTARRAGRS
jgi:hypothetical protein